MICSKFITFAVTKTTVEDKRWNDITLWFAQNSLPLRWQRQPWLPSSQKRTCCDLLKIHYLCGDKDNSMPKALAADIVVICSKFITFAVTKTTNFQAIYVDCRCDLLKIHYLCGDKDNWSEIDNDETLVVICSKFITFAVTKTTSASWRLSARWLWFAQNSLPLRWQRQLKREIIGEWISCDLLKIHYLCGDKDNTEPFETWKSMLWFAQNSLPLRWQRQLQRQRHLQ